MTTNQLDNIKTNKIQLYNIKMTKHQLDNISTNKNKLTKVKTTKNLLDNFKMTKNQLDKIKTTNPSCITSARLKISWLTTKMTKKPVG